jgi:hypothetical protein
MGGAKPMHEDKDEAGRSGARSRLSASEQADLRRLLGLDEQGAMTSADMERVEWDSWRERTKSAKPMIIRKPKAPSSAPRSQEEARVVRRRLGPLCKALRRAREEASEASWIGVARELAQVALDAPLPEREAVSILSAASVDAAKWPPAAARELLGELARERLWSVEPELSFGELGTPRAQKLWRMWMALTERA